MRRELAVDTEGEQRALFVRQPRRIGQTALGGRRFNDCRGR